MSSKDYDARRRRRRRRREYFKYGFGEDAKPAVVRTPLTLRRSLNVQVENFLCSNSYVTRKNLTFQKIPYPNFG
jgi:hypothetical protein